MKEKLLSRDDFREGVFKAQDAHHILERRLFADGGYYLSNGASVCGPCHIKCETTQISVEDIRLAAKITKAVIPEHFYPDTIYDKWGNSVLSNGQRTVGELFFDESVQKILMQGGKINLFTDKVKYPRTYHLPFSLGVSKDDKVLSLDNLIDFYRNKRVILTEKMDGENTTMYNDYIHARLVDGRHHKSRDWVKSFWSKMAYEIPEKYRICGENLYAEHSIKYDNLKSYFYMFSMWNDKNICMDWDETVEWASLLEIPMVSVLYDGVFDLDKIQKICKNIDTASCEGVMLRVADSFSYKDFRKSVAKFVRENHIATGEKWMFNKKMTLNGLA